jgi:xanthine/CO dehydrogenase XdhC/CoxF family maturation factor
MTKRKMRGRRRGPDGGRPRLILAAGGRQGRGLVMLAARAWGTVGGGKAEGDVRSHHRSILMSVQA